jgi:hypothetical protein
MTSSHGAYKTVVSRVCHHVEKVACVAVHLGESKLASKVLARDIVLLELSAQLLFFQEHTRHCIVLSGKRKCYNEVKKLHN